MKNNILITGKKGFIGRNIDGGKEFIGNIANYMDVDKATNDVLGIVHLAAKSSKTKCEENYRECINSNLIGLCNILDIAFKKKLWVLFASTFQVKEPTLYGLTKLLGEELCRLYKKKGLRVSIIRLPIIYGPNDRVNKVVTKIINELKMGKEPVVHNHLEFNFLYVKDAAKRIESEVNVLEGGFGMEYTIRDLISGIKECLNEEKK